MHGQQKIELYKKVNQSINQSINQPTLSQEHLPSSLVLTLDLKDASKW